MRRSNVDVPGYETSEIYTSAGAALLLPTCEVEALDAAREAERRARADAVEAIVRDVAARRAADTDKQGGDPMNRAEGACRKIFDVDEVNETLEIHGKGDRERLAQLKSWAGKMCRDEGYRRVQPFPDRLDVLREEFPNFSRVIDGIESLVALSAGSGRLSCPRAHAACRSPGDRQDLVCGVARDDGRRGSGGRLARGSPRIVSDTRYIDALVDRESGAGLEVASHRPCSERRLAA